MIMRITVQHEGPSVFKCRVRVYKRMADGTLVERPDESRLLSISEVSEHNLGENRLVTVEEA